MEWPVEPGSSRLEARRVPRGHPSISSMIGHVKPLEDHVSENGDRENFHGISGSTRMWIRSPILVPFSVSRRFQCNDLKVVLYKEVSSGKAVFSHRKKRRV